MGLADLPARARRLRADDGLKPQVEIWAPAAGGSTYERFWDDHFSRLKRHLEKGDER